MSRFKVAVTDYVFPNLDPETEVLAEVDAELVPGQSKTKDDVLALVRGVDAVLNTYFGPIDGEVMDAMPSCRIIVRYGVGVDTIDIPAATARGIMVANVPDYCVDEVSDHAVAMLLALVRKLPQGDRRVRAGDWALAPLKPITSLRGMTVGIVGMGRIGREIARKLAVFGPPIIYHDPYAAGPDLACYLPVSLDDLFASAQAIILQAPATPETHHLFSDAAFAAMANKPIIINCARGELIDTDALVRALEAGQVSAAGLDVIEDAPPLAVDHPLLTFNSVLITPHSAWLSEQALHNLQLFAAMEVARALRGERLNSLLNPEVLK
jgi:D-3-phosphoglycerate dehydrogenase